MKLQLRSAIRSHPVLTFAPAKYIDQRFISSLGPCGGIERGLNGLSILTLRLPLKGKLRSALVPRSIPARLLIFQTSGSSVTGANRIGVRVTDFVCLAKSWSRAYR